MSKYFTGLHINTVVEVGNYAAFVLVFGFGATFFASTLRSVSASSQIITCKQ